MYKTSACDKISEILSDLLEMFVPIPILPESPNSEMKNEIIVIICYIHNVFGLFHFLSKMFTDHKLLLFCIKSIKIKL